MIPSKHRITELLVEDVHRENLHQDLQQTLYKERKKFWIPKGGTTVKRVLRECRVFKRWKGGPFVLPATPPLPLYRATRAFPFQRSGLDYFGPIQVKRMHATVKIWGCLWTCLVTRAIHLDTVSSLSASDFIEAFRRFVARRGIPEIILSDNASTFTAAGKVIVDECQKREIEERMKDEYGDVDDSEYRPQNEVEIFNEQYKKGPKIIHKFWDVWKKEYSLSLKEHQKMEHPRPRIVTVREPEIGENSKRWFIVILMIDKPSEERGEFGKCATEPRHYTPIKLGKHGNPSIASRSVGSVATGIARR
ncbi:unnamed protein product [Anisakis simplex]|uniref:Integrase zinc-binding domain-containing protein n=1 Tax=Anisakis simplex TaxID=6269 RepID=A0A3P6NUH9_ANISI|nr:unnamed protein product [Anisakis simplex]